MSSGISDPSIPEAWENQREQLKRLIKTRRTLHNKYIFKKKNITIVKLTLKYQVQLIAHTVMLGDVQMILYFKCYTHQFESDIFIGLRLINYFLQICSNCNEKKMFQSNKQNMNPELLHKISQGQKCEKNMQHWASGNHFCPMTL